jgi:hypothetical protein
MIQNILIHLISVCPHQTMVHTFHSSFPESGTVILECKNGPYEPISPEDILE